MTSHRILTASLLVAALAAAANAEVVYDFETSRITSGSLGTQDNWHIDDAGFGGFGVVDAGTNGTRTLSGRAIISRVNNADWSFDIDFASTAWGFSFDFSPAGGTRYAYLGGDSDTNNILDSSEFYGYTGGGFHIHGTPTIYTDSEAVSFDLAHWYRSAWVFNWVDMTVSTYYKDLTAGGDYIALTGIQDIDLVSSAWLGLSGFTSANLGFGIYQYPTSEVDNYTFGATVPEPASVALLAIGAGVVLSRRRPAR